MIGRTNTGAGGGSCLALIRVLYKAGTTATCTNGTITFLSDQSGDYLFLLPVAGTWTVTGTSASDVVKTITVTLARGDAKTITIDTLIPPAYRSTYREVEYIQMLDQNTAYRGNIPTGILLSPGAWDLELEQFWLRNPTNSSWTAISSYSSRLFYGPFGDGRVKLTNSSDYLSSGPIVTELDRDYKIHWSSGAEEKKISLTMDNEELISSTDTVALSGNWQLYICGDPEWLSLCWPGKYRAVKVTLDGVLLHHFIPAKRISDGMPGYFDLLTNEFKQGYQNTDGTITKVLEVMTPGPEIGT